MAIHPTAISSALLASFVSFTSPVAWAQDTAGAESYVNSYTTNDQAASAVAAYANGTSVGVWTTGGPYGGNIQALAIDPTTPATLYAGTSGGVSPTTPPC
jgi:hypothetical protein